MSKTIRNVFDSKLTFIKLIEAHERSSKSKKCHTDVIRFETNLESNITNLCNEIKNNRYKMGNYREFIVKEPKERLIKALPYRDRIVHQWYIGEFIKPFIVKRFIKDSYACIDNKGTHKAVDNLQIYMQKMQRNFGNYYILKCDISKFFYNIDRKILLNILGSYIKDSKLMNFTSILIGNLDEIGIPIGNYTSQFFANIYLNELDHYVKDDLKIKYYLRYMDDFVLLVESKEKAKQLLNKIDLFVNDILHLKLNKKTSYFPNKNGVDFCGYKIFETHILLRKRNIKKMKKTISILNKKYVANNLDMNEVIIKLSSFKAHAKHADTYNIREKIYDSLLFKQESSKISKILL